MKVLIVESDKKLLSNLALCLKVRYSDTDVVSVDQPQRALTHAESESPDLIFIDCSIPDLDLIGFIGRIRRCSSAPLLIISDGETDMDRARGLEAGADEYISSSFSPIELLAKCKALLRRSRGLSFAAEESVDFDGLTVNFTTHEVFVEGQAVKLTHIEYGLLSELAKNEGRVVTTPVLLDKVWGDEYVRDLDLVKTYVYRLRAKLKLNSGSPDRIINNRGFGYMLARQHGANRKSDAAKMVNS